MRPDHIRIVLIAASILFLGSCIREKQDPKDCLTGVDIHFFSRTRCQTEPVYPAEIKDINYFIFDDKDILVSSGVRKGITLDADFHLETQLTSSGLYTVVAWAGVEDGIFEKATVQPGTTRKDDLFLRLTRRDSIASAIDGRFVYMGESPAVYVPEAGDASAFTEARVNLREVINRITVTVDNLPDPSRYETVIVSDNGSMNIDGSIAGDTLLRFDGIITDRTETLQTIFTLLKLETGSTYTITLRNTSDGSELFSGSLLGALIMANPAVNLECVHDFNIDITVRDDCNCRTYVITEIWVNDWLVHSYGTEM